MAENCTPERPSGSWKLSIQMSMDENQPILWRTLVCFFAINQYLLQYPMIRIHLLSRTESFENIFCSYLYTGQVVWSSDKSADKFQRKVRRNVESFQKNFTRNSNFLYWNVWCSFDNNSRNFLLAAWEKRDSPKAISVEKFTRTLRWTFRQHHPDFFRFQVKRQNVSEKGQSRFSWVRRK